MNGGRIPIPSTFSIVAADLQAEEWGVAVQSRYFAVGAAVPHARAGVGALATQAWFHPDHGRQGLELLSSGLPADGVIERLVAEEGATRDVRQVAVVDRMGSVAAWTGTECVDWAGHQVGIHYCCQGNILAGPGVVPAMATAFEESAGRLADRMIAGLRAGQAAGGDRRGRQSAALLVVRNGSGFAGIGDRGMDIRVDDHPDPIEELARLLNVYRGTVWGQLAEGAVGLGPEAVTFIQLILTKTGLYRGEAHGQLDVATHQALETFARLGGLQYDLTADSLHEDLFRELCSAYAG